MKDQNHKHLFSLLYCSHTFYYRNLCCHFSTTITGLSAATKHTMTIDEMYTTSIKLCFTQIVKKQQLYNHYWQREKTARQKEQNTRVVHPVCGNYTSNHNTETINAYEKRSYNCEKWKLYNSLSFHVHF